MSAKQWFTVEILYNYRQETKPFYFLNCDAGTVQKLRYQLFDKGIQLPFDTKSWVVVLPWRVDSFTSTLQEKFLDEVHSSRTKTVFTTDQKVKHE